MTNCFASDLIFLEFLTFFTRDKQYCYTILDNTQFFLFSTFGQISSPCTF